MNILFRAFGQVVLYFRRRAARSLTRLEKAPVRVYCTKHVLTQPLPGGPEHLAWVYGSHRTRGNACDGPEHRRQGPVRSLFILPRPW